MKKIERLLVIVLALKNYGRLTARQLADKLEVNIRTIYRDMDALCQMDIPLVAESGKEGGYELLDHYFLPSVSFTQDEVLALAIADKLITETKIPGFSDLVESSFLKIKNIMNEENKRKAKQILGRIVFNLKSMYLQLEDKKYFPLIKTSFLENRILKLTYYFPARRKSQQLMIKPILLNFWSGGWYLYAQSTEDDKIWCYRLDRITHLELSEETFQLPDAENLMEFCWENEIYKEKQIKLSARLKLSLSLYNTVKNDNMFKDSQILEQNDQAIILLTKEILLEYIIEFAFCNYDQSEILGPDSLREKFREILGSLTKKYTS
ncbi:MAG: YafY family transcriptional regulator [Spirochaetes bacterium]|nr:YafY family transcriptional regulator [Spirochaetota bacterium]